MNEPITQKGYRVRSRMTDKQPQFYIHHLLHMFKFRCDIIFTGRTAVTETPTSMQALSNVMRLVTQCGMNCQQGERNQKETYKPTILKPLTPCILINFLPFNKPTKCTYNSTVSIQVCSMNEHCAVYPFVEHTRGTKTTDYSAQFSTTDVSVWNITFKINSNKILTIYIILTTYIVIIVNCILITLYNTCIWETRSLAVCCGIALQTRRSRVRFPKTALNFSRT